MSGLGPQRLSFGSAFLRNCRTSSLTCRPGLADFRTRTAVESRCCGSYRRTTDCIRVSARRRSPVLSGRWARKACLGPYPSGILSCPRTPRNMSTSTAREVGACRAPPDGLSDSWPAINRPLSKAHSLTRLACCAITGPTKSAVAFLVDEKPAAKPAKKKGRILRTALPGAWLCPDFGSTERPESQNTVT